MSINEDIINQYKIILTPLPHDYKEEILRSYSFNRIVGNFRLIIPKFEHNILEIIDIIIEYSNYPEFPNKFEIIGPGNDFILKFINILNLKGISKPYILNYSFIYNIISYIISFSDKSYMIHNILISIFKKYSDIIDEDIYKLIENIGSISRLDMIIPIFRYMLSIDGLPNIVFEIVESELILSLSLVAITITDDEYNKYNVIYLNKFIDYINNNKYYFSDNIIKIANSGKWNKYTLKNKEAIEILRFTSDPLYKHLAHYNLAKIRLVKNNKSLEDIDYIIEHLLLSDDYLDSKQLKNRLIQEYYIKDKFNTSIIDINLDTDSIIKLLKMIK